MIISYSTPPPRAALGWRRSTLAYQAIANAFLVPGAPRGALGARRPREAQARTRTVYCSLVDDAGRYRRAAAGRDAADIFATRRAIGWRWACDTFVDGLLCRICARDEAGRDARSHTGIMPPARLALFPAGDCRSGYRAELRRYFRRHHFHHLPPKEELTLPGAFRRAERRRMTATHRA